MHSESLSAFCGFPVEIAKPDLGAPPPEPLDGPPPLSAVPPPVAVDDEDEDVWLLEVLELLTLATPGVLLPPPQPAMNKPTTTSAATETSARGPAPRRWRAVTVSAGRIVGGSFASASAGIGGKE